MRSMIHLYLTAKTWAFRILVCFVRHATSSSIIDKTPLRFDATNATKFTDRCVRCISTKGSRLKDRTGVGQGPHTPEKSRLAGARMPPRRLRPLVSWEGIKQPPRWGENWTRRISSTREYRYNADELCEAFTNTERHIIVGAFYTSTRTAYVSVYAVHIWKKKKKKKKKK